MSVDGADADVDGELMGLSIRYVSHDDLPRLSEFVAQAYPGQRQATLMQDAWARQYVYNPYNCYDGPTILICEANNAIVGHLGMIPVQVSIGGRLAQAVWVVDWYVLPEFRKHAVGLMLLRHAMKGQDIAMSLGSGDVAREILRRMGWVDLGRLKDFRRLTNAPALIRRLTRLPVFPELLGLPVQWLYHCLFDLPYKRTAVQVHEVMRFDDRANVLWQSLAPRLGTLVCRDQRMLNWRFADAALPRYHLLVAEDAASGEFLGYVTSRPNEGQTWLMCDILVALDRPDAFGALVSATVRIATVEGARWLTADLMYPTYERWLARCGFLRRNSCQHLFVWVPRSAQRTLGTVLKRESWLVTCADSDADRYWRW